MKPGQKLPPERDLAGRFQVSRTSIREALRVLEINGIVEVRPGGGNFIRPLEVQALVDDLAAAVNKAVDSLIFEILEVRRIIETECAALAAQRATSRDLERIRRCLDDMARSEHDEELGLAADLSFHYSIARATNNSALLGLMKALGEHMKETIKATRRHRFSKPGRFADTLDEHRQIYLSIAVKDSTRASKLMEDHIVRIGGEMASISLEEAPAGRP